MRMEERMYRDPGTEPHSFQSSADWFPLQTGKGLICLAYDDGKKKRKEKVSCSFFIGILINPFILLAHDQ